jgi:nucleoside phosphorylase
MMGAQRQQLEFLAELCRRSSVPELRGLLIEDLFWRASQLGDEGIEYALRASILGSPDYYPQERLLALVEGIPPRRKIDLLLMAVKKVELHAVQAAFGVSRSSRGIRGQSDLQFWESEVVLPEEGKTLSVAITFASIAQNYKMSVLTARALMDYRPKMVALIGMAAGRQKKTELGDVVLATKVLDYGSSVLTEAGMVPNPQSYSPNVDALSVVATFDSALGSWRGTVEQLLRDEIDLEGSEQQELPRKLLSDPSSYAPTLHAGDILSADYLMEDDSFESRAAAVLSRGALAAEMEGAGFAFMCDRSGIPWTIIRGVADHGKPSRKKDWQYASTVSAACAFRELLVHGSIHVG